MHVSCILGCEVSSVKWLAGSTDPDAVAHKAAWTLAKVLHCDISADNILIDVETGEGFLNDWDLAKTQVELDNASNTERLVRTVPLIITRRGINHC